MGKKKERRTMNGKTTSKKSKCSRCHNGEGPCGKLEKGEGGDGESGALEREYEKDSHWNIGETGGGVHNEKGLNFRGLKKGEEYGGKRGHADLKLLVATEPEESPLTYRGACRTLMGGGALTSRR